MPQTLLQINNISDNYGFTVHAAVLKWLIHLLNINEPEIVKIIASMCGVFFNSNLYHIGKTLIDMSITQLDENYRRPGGAPPFAQPLPRFSLTTEELASGNYLGAGLRNNCISKHADYMIGKHIESTQNSNMAYRKIDVLREICKKWGIDENDLIYKNATWIKMLLNQEQTLLLNQEQTPINCTLIIWQNNDSYHHDNMVNAHSSEIIEIIIPKGELNYDIWRDSYVKVTKDSYKKMYKGNITRALARELNLGILSHSTALSEYRINTERDRTALQEYFAKYLECQQT